MVECINSACFELAECPVWNVKDRMLYWTDILGGSIWRYQPKDKTVALVWKGSEMVGGFAFTPENDMVICSEKGISKLKRKEQSFLDASCEKIFDIPMAKGERFNDITTDPKGRILAGTLRDTNKDGKLYRIQEGEEPTVLISEIGISNGMTFSLDEKYFYHTDSQQRTITRYQYNINLGEISNPKLFYKGCEEDGAPDGITVDTEGNIWAACWGGSKVIRINGEGQVSKTIEVPAIQVSSLVFGDEGLNILYITTAAIGCKDMSTGMDETGNYLGGKLYRFQTDSSGRAEWWCIF